MSFFDYEFHTVENGVIELVYGVAELSETNETEYIQPYDFEEFLGKEGYLDDYRKDYRDQAYTHFMLDFDHMDRDFHVIVFEKYFNNVIAHRHANELDYEADMKHNLANKLRGLAA